jgi:two-component system, NtrC family, sensor histidine kinase HydH
MGSTKTRVALLGVSIFVITVAHYATPIEASFLHNIYQRLYYLPILAGAYWFGVRGALVVALVSAGSYLPHIVTDWHDRVAYRQAQFAELLMFQAVALVVGTLAEHEKRQRRELEQSAAELAAAYRRLQESFEQLRRADRLSALGQLSAGLAHEIKNPLASMKGSLEIVAEDFPAGHEKREFLEIFKKELDRLNAVLTEFLQFARPPRPDRQPCRIEDVLESIRIVCSSEAERAGVALALACDRGIPEISADAGQLQQAFLNIVLNGIQAMPGGGRLGIDACRRNGALEVAVSDEGPGIPEAARSHVFDPFFTTKDRGTGLGLSIAHNLVRGHGGDIHIEDRAGGGLRFVVVLPLEGDPR